MKIQINNNKTLMKNIFEKYFNHQKNNVFKELKFLNKNILENKN
jgi:hypothetical protein